MRPARSIRDYLLNAVEDRLAMTRPVLENMNALLTELVAWRSLPRTDETILMDALESIKSGETAVSTLDGLDDVTVTDPKAGDLLTLSSGTWINKYNPYRQPAQFRDELLIRELQKAIAGEVILSDQVLAIPPNRFTLHNGDPLPTSGSSLRIENGTIVMPAFNRISYESSVKFMSPGRLINILIESPTDNDKYYLTVTHDNGSTAVTNKFQFISASDSPVKIVFAQRTTVSDFENLSTIRVDFYNLSPSETKVNGVILHFS